MTDETSTPGNESLDIIKIYIIAMGIFSVVSLFWMIYGYLAVGEYKEHVTRGLSDLEEIVHLESALPPKENRQKVELENALTFFTKTVRGISDEPTVQIHPPDTLTVNGVNFEERKFSVKFENGITRYELARYIFRLQQEKPFLRAKRIDLQKVDSDRIPSHQESTGWIAEIDFAYRK